MKKTAFFLILIVGLASTASAQLPSKPFSLYIQGGVSLPQEDFGDLYKLGYHGAGGLGISIFPKVEAVGRVSYHKYSPESVTSMLGVESPIDVDGGDLTMLMYGADLKLNLGVLVTNPYLLAGYGWAKFDIEDVTFSASGVEHTQTSDSHTDNYWILGGGIEFSRTFIEGRYITFLEDDDDEAESDSKSRLITVSLGFKL
ncbi:MAG: outer membrane beta-barrel protein [candidate division Zixibacteria bacterium]|nr:outer membrane beta-barrel protein [candidate division Zixibacteria bacterium]